jgi:hypothetical protein
MRGKEETGAGELGSMEIKLINVEDKQDRCTPCE